MKIIVLLVLAISLVSCASQSEREPSSVDPQDVSHGLNADYYGTR
jgi:hypothetical protein